MAIEPKYFQDFNFKNVSTRVHDFVKNKKEVLATFPENSVRAPFHPQTQKCPHVFDRQQSNLILEVDNYPSAGGLLLL